MFSLLSAATAGIPGRPAIAGATTTATAIATTTATLPGVCTGRRKCGRRWCQVESTVLFSLTKRASSALQSQPLCRNSHSQSHPRSTLLICTQKVTRCVRLRLTLADRGRSVAVAVDAAMPAQKAILRDAPRYACPWPHPHLTITLALLHLAPLPETVWSRFNRRPSSTGQHCQVAALAPTLASLKAVKLIYADSTCSFAHGFAARASSIPLLSSKRGSTCLPACRFFECSTAICMLEAGCAASPLLFAFVCHLIGTSAHATLPNPRLHSLGCTDVQPSSLASRKRRPQLD